MVSSKIGSAAVAFTSGPPHERLDFLDGEAAIFVGVHALKMRS
jgi:hypothetical protein